MSRFLERVASGDVLISDGATGTYLQENGLEPGGCPEEFNLKRPDVVRGMAAAYFEAGSDIVETNSFGGSRYMLAKYGHGDRVEELNRLAGQLAREAAPVDGFVLGSMGPTGEILEEKGGTADSEEMYEVFCEQATGLAAGGVDAVCVETMSDVTGEMTLAIRAVKAATGLPVVATLCYDRGPRGLFTMMGDTPESTALALAEAGADVVGSNCGIAIGDMIEVIAAMRGVTDLPILTHVNAGIPSIVSGEIVYPDEPEFMAEQMRKVIEAGANIVGGCCGTGPAHVRAFSLLLRDGAS
ncbi:MAG: methionine synthase [Planctomycetaceae bacterium]|nr:methionine synthase [Planctomycetaceae bacterium]|tara:strand:+ start:822 stop:1715 length:894 start_codon:yes stop_codon:yes gene_type:complete